MALSLDNLRCGAIPFEPQDCGVTVVEVLVHCYAMADGRVMAATLERSWKWPASILANGLHRSKVAMVVRTEMREKEERRRPPIRMAGPRLTG